MVANNIPRREYLCEVFHYEDGSLRWKERPRHHFNSARSYSIWHARFCGRIAGRLSPSSGYRQVMLDGVRLLEHRVIAAMHGMDTSHVIDHIDGDRSNNRVVNLRSCTFAQNAMNHSGWKSRKVRCGVYQRKDSGRWIAYIRENGKQRLLGTFGTESEAVKAREDAEKRVYGPFARGAVLANEPIAEEAEA